MSMSKAVQLARNKPAHTGNIGQTEVECHTEGGGVEDSLFDNTGFDVIDQEHASNIFSLDSSYDQC